MTNKVVHQEVAYQLNKGLSRLLHKGKKVPWPTFPLRIILYEMKSHKTRDEKIEELDRFHFAVKDFRGYDPRRV